MTRFYERNLVERVALTEAAIRERRTLIERWSVLEAPEAQPWNERAAIAAEYLRDQPSVADFGCGTMSLADRLQPDQRYIPLDVVARDARTLVCDLNKQPPPETGASAAAFLGLLEYLYDPPSVFRHIHGQYQVLVVSYCITDAPKSPHNRRQHGWVNDFSEAGLKDIFRQTSWVAEQEKMIDDKQKIWRLAIASP